jgi:hypothetical protein
MRLLTTTLALSLFATTVLAATPAHTSAAGSVLQPAAVQAFDSIAAPAGRCGADANTVGNELQGMQDPLNAAHLGSLRADALRLEQDCRYTASRVAALHFRPGQPIARRVQSELLSAFLDGAQGGHFLVVFNDDVTKGDDASAMSDMGRVYAAFKAAQSHTNVALHYVRPGDLLWLR